VLQNSSILEVSHTGICDGYKRWKFREKFCPRVWDMNFLNFSQKNAFFWVTKISPDWKKIERMRIGGPYAWTKFQFDRWKIRGFMAKKPSSSWAPMEPDIYTYRRKKSANGVGVIHSSTITTNNENNNQKHIIFNLNDTVAIQFWVLIALNRVLNPFVSTRSDAMFGLITTLCYDHRWKKSNFRKR